MIPVMEPYLGEDELNNVTEAVKSSWISSQGKFIGEFEEGFANYHRVRYGVSTSNGTAALHLALKGLNIGKGDEVIVPSLTFAATANAVIYCNAEPVLVDSNLEYWCMDPVNIEDKITKRTKAIIPVHLYGHPCDMDIIMDIAEDHSLYVVEDAAEAHGAEYKRKKVGTFGNISCYSFYGNKLITTGEGGICLTDDETLDEKIRILRDHGMNPNKRYWHDVIGFNYRMTNLQAAIGVAQLNKLDEFIEKKRNIASYYQNTLRELKDDGLISLHPEMPWAKSVYWIYSILIEDKFNLERDNVIDELRDRGIDTRPLFYPINIMPPYKSVKLPNAEELSRKGLSLPSSITLGHKDISKITDELKEL
ncbi:MAG: DegT/DnrJ/EryC1/StrS family aminotransferase [Methanobacteriaceae archaeon]